jgi:hypothetical protein
MTLLPGAARMTFPPSVSTIGPSRSRRATSMILWHEWPFKRGTFHLSS